MMQKTVELQLATSSWRSYRTQPLCHIASPLISAYLQGEDSRASAGEQIRCVANVSVVGWTQPPCQAPYWRMQIVLESLARKKKKTTAC